MSRPSPRFAGTLLSGAATIAIEVARIGREVLAIPAGLWLAAAEIAGALVLAGWRLVARAALYAYGRLAAAVRWGQRHVRPTYGVIAVCVAATLTLGGSQLLDYRGVSVGTPSYAEVEEIAPPPEIDRERPSSAHAWGVGALAAAALAIVAIAVFGRWRAARLLVGVGIAVIAISLAVDVPRGLDEGEAAVAYEGADALLLEGFWAQVVSGSVLILCGPLLALHLRNARGRPERSRRRDRNAGAGALAPPPIGTGSGA
ncbi:MAG TPA: hypothetical protein VK919_10755 [Solirubrobacterales bacterium]|nr:hypothetical protein [Solirubrobacterales bacterium]